jgi:uncharacterized protein YndB with AHSA1/START domain
MSQFVLEDAVKATPATVFDVYTDHRAYADLIGPIRTAELEQEGKPAPNGTGAIRKLHMPGATVREQVTEYDRPNSYSYKMLSGLPLREFKATVTFTPTEQGTAVAYDVTVTGSIGALPVKFPSQETIRLFMKKAAARAERNARPQQN